MYEDFLSKLEYASNSPYLGKVIYDKYSDKSNIVFSNTQETIARNISSKAAYNETIRKEHQEVLEAMKVAASNPTPYIAAVYEFYKTEQEKINRSTEAARERYINFPKKDVDYIESRKAEIDKLNNKKAKKRREIEAKFGREVQKHKSKLVSWIVFDVFFFIGSIILYIWFANGINEMISYGHTEDGWAKGAMFILLAILNVIFWVLTNETRKKTKMSTYSIAINNEIEKISKYYDDLIKSAERDIERGFSPSSQFNNKLQAVLNETNRIVSENGQKSERLAFYTEIIKNGFGSIITTLQCVLDNFDSINQWASNYIRDQEQIKHNWEMKRIEEEKLYELQETQRVQQQALREQSSFLQKQAQAAEDQLRLAEQQAKDIAEMKQRYNEEIGAAPRAVPRPWRE